MRSDNSQPLKGNCDALAGFLKIVFPLFIPSCGLGYLSMPCFYAKFQKDICIVTGLSSRIKTLAINLRMCLWDDYLTLYTSSGYHQMVERFSSSRGSFRNPDEGCSDLRVAGIAPTRLYKTKHIPKPAWWCFHQSAVWDDRCFCTSFCDSLDNEELTLEAFLAFTPLGLGKWVMFVLPRGSHGSLHISQAIWGCTQGNAGEKNLLHREKCTFPNKALPGLRHAPPLGFSELKCSVCLPLHPTGAYSHAMVLLGFSPSLLRNTHIFKPIYRKMWTYQNKRKAVVSVLLWNCK